MAGDLEDELVSRLMVFDEPTRRPIKPEMIEGLVRYKDHRIETGGFLRAVLENDLKEAVQRADLENQRSLCSIVAWCYNNMPAHAWGSPERVRLWLAN